MRSKEQYFQSNIHKLHLNVPTLADDILRRIRLISANIRILFPNPCLVIAFICDPLWVQTQTCCIGAFWKAGHRFITNKCCLNQNMFKISPRK